MFFGSQAFGDDALGSSGEGPQARKCSECGRELSAPCLSDPEYRARLAKAADARRRRRDAFSQLLDRLKKA